MYVQTNLSQIFTFSLRLDLIPIYHLHTTFIGSSFIGSTLASSTTNCCHLSFNKLSITIRSIFFGFSFGKSIKSLLWLSLHVVFFIKFLFIVFLWIDIDAQEDEEGYQSNEWYKNTCYLPSHSITSIACSISFDC